MYGYDDYSIGDKLPSIIIDLGCLYTKIGYSHETEPREIIKTINFIDYFSFYKNIIINYLGFIKSHSNSENGNKQYKYLKILDYIIDIDTKEFKNSLEEFVNDILFQHLQIPKKKRDKSFNCVLLTDKNPSFEKLYEMFSNQLMESNFFANIVTLDSKITPIFCSGTTSGIVLNIGSINSSIMLIYNNFIKQSNIKEVDISVFKLIEKLTVSIIHENFYKKQNKFKISTLASLLSTINMNDLLARLLICPNKSVVDNFIEDDINKYRLETNNLDISYKNENGSINLNLSLLSRVNLIESMFDSCIKGDFEFSEKSNVVEYIIDLLTSCSSEVRNKVAQNVILSGGVTNCIGLHKRLSDELKKSIQERDNLHLQSLLQRISVHKILYSRNCLSWIGCK